MTERQECIPVAPTEREYAGAFHVRATDMVVDTGQQFSFLGAIAAEQRIVKDEDIPPGFVRQRCNGLLDEPCSGVA